jgi:hypothetical protein
MGGGIILHPLGGEMDYKELDDLTDQIVAFAETIKQMSEQLDLWYAVANDAIPATFQRSKLQEVYNRDLFYRMLSVSCIKMSIDLKDLANKMGGIGEIVNMLTSTPLPLPRNAKKLEEIFLIWSKAAKEQYGNPINVSQRNRNETERKTDERGEMDGEMPKP